MDLTEVETVFSKWLVLEDLNVVRVTMAAVAANRIEGDPFLALPNRATSRDQDRNDQFAFWPFILVPAFRPYGPDFRQQHEEHGARPFSSG